MTKEEFEKEFKVGDDITQSVWEECDVSTLLFIGNTKVMIESSDGYDYSYDINSSWQKVEPVKKYWKHVVLNLDGFVTVYVKDSETKVTGLISYLKEPTEITLEDI